MEMDLLTAALSAGPAAIVAFVLTSLILRWLTPVRDAAVKYFASRTKGDSDE